MEAKVHHKPIAARVSNIQKRHGALRIQAECSNCVLYQQKNELVGFTTASPQVTLLQELKNPPRLERYKLFNGNEFVGEMLAAFHLLEVRLLKDQSFLLIILYCSILLHIPC
jgi:hypothetical protein